MSVSLRIPRGLWDDLETSVIKQDRQFLTEVARSLGLPVQDVLRKCLVGRPTCVPTLWLNHDDPEGCPWYSARGSLWFRCERKRLSPNLPCCVHERPSHHNKLKTDPVIQEAVRYLPVLRQGVLYWVSPDGYAVHEDGSPKEGGIFILTTHKGKRIAIWKAD